MATKQTTIQREFIGAKYNGIEDTTKELSQICGSEVVFIEDKIFDAVDDDETEDTHTRVAHFKCPELMVDIYIYYYNVSLEVNFASVETEIKPQPTLKIGDKVMWRGSWGKDAPQKTNIESIELTPYIGCKDDGEPIQSMTKDNYERCLITLTNDHWCYGYQIDWEDSIALN